MLMFSGIIICEYYSRLYLVVKSDFEKTYFLCRPVSREMKKRRVASRFAGGGCAALESLLAQAHIFLCREARMAEVFRLRCLSVYLSAETRTAFFSRLKRVSFFDQGETKNSGPTCGTGVQFQLMFE